MIYVAAMPATLRGQFADQPRLYAYPAEPEPGELIILDSGAYALAQQGRRIDAEHMRALAAHYTAHRAGHARPIVAVAPDEYLSPRRTMANWRWWQERIGTPVAPVIQFTKPRRTDLYAILQQCRAYAAHKPPFVLVSNPGYRGVQAVNDAAFVEAVRLIRQWLPGAWLHFLGAGWDAADLRAWAKWGGFDSMDSIAYYTAAQNGEAWDGAPPDPDWRVTARRNFLLAQEIVRGHAHVQP